jgi:hypothetical protein
MQKILLLGLAVLLLSAGTASAERGVALDLGKVEIAQALTPGGSYHLPPVGVRNPGDDRTTYRMVVSSVAGQSRAPVPESWVHFSPGEVTLGPGQTRKVQPRLSLPTGADPGNYEGLLAAQIVTGGAGTQVGAAAAAKLTFEVESTTLLGAWWHKLSTASTEHAPWTWLIPAVLASALVASQLRRRFSFRVEKRT